MIAFVKGILSEKNPTRVVVQVSGIGFELLIPVSTFEQLPEPGSEIVLQTYLHVREDALILVGFATSAERELFQLLLSVSGIGIRLGLGILSSAKPADFYRALAEGNEGTLTRTPGLGKKMAQRLILDLKDKAATQMSRFASETAPASGRMNLALQEEAVQAMTALGYSRPEALRLIEKATTMFGDTITIEELLRAALQG